MGNVTSHSPDHSHNSCSTQWNGDMCKLRTLNIEYQTPKCNPKLNCDTLWPWPLHLDFPSAPVCFLLSYCSCCSRSHICSMTPVPLTLLSRTCSVPIVPRYDPSVLSHVVSLKAIKSQCHVTIPQFKYRNCQALSLAWLRLVLALTLSLVSCTIILSFSSSCLNSEPWPQLPNPEPTWHIWNT